MAGGLSIDGPDTLAGALLVVVLGLAVTGYGAYDYTQQSDALEEAVEVDATVTEVGVETTSGGSSSSGVDYRPEVRFSYEYRGDSYNGTDLFPASIDATYDTESAARDALDGYETGERVTAYVVPDEPRNAFLRDRASDAPLIAMGLGALMTLLGGALSVKRYREP
jgi:hypothetical protein